MSFDLRPGKLLANSLLKAGSVIVLILLTVSLAFGFDFDRLQKTLIQKFGTSSVRLLQDWKTLLSDTKSLPEPDKLKQINEFFNRKITFSDDQVVWGKADYWATPLEIIGKDAGDCEDFVIAKYFSLKEIGVPIQKLRLTYVRAKIGGPSSTITQAHMVLAYYATPESEPLVLDNLISDIRPASRRPDLAPIFSFNSDGIWAAGSTAPASNSVDRLSRWKDLLLRMQAEGFD